IESPVHQFYRLFIDDEVFGIHFVLRQIFDINRPESTQANVERYKRHVYPLDLEALKQLTGKVHSGRRRRNGALVFGINRLKSFLVFGFYFPLNVFGKGSLSERFDYLVESLSISVEKKANCPPARGCVINHFRDEISISKV